METLNHLWSPAPKDLILADNEVHVWRAQLELPSSQVQRLRGILTDDELDRANRFSFEIDRQRFIAARGTLRSILSCYITIYPSHLRFYYNQYGKPFLAPEFSSYLLNFNLSHSGSMALYAITRNMEIGVDVERVRSDFEYEEIAKRFFSVNEVAILRTIPTEKKLEAFYNCWTRKEAYIKAHGKGFVPPKGKGWVNSIRKRGNIANHEIRLMNAKDADLMLHFVEGLLRFNFELPNMLEEDNQE